MGRPFCRYSLRIFKMRWKKPWIAFVLPEHLSYMCHSLNRRQYTVLNTKSWDLGFKAARFRNWSLFDFSLVDNITDHGRRSYQTKRRISALSSNNNFCVYLCTGLDVIYNEQDGWGLLADEKRNFGCFELRSADTLTSSFMVRRHLSIRHLSIATGIHGDNYP